MMPELLAALRKLSERLMMEDGAVDDALEGGAESDGARIRDYLDVQRAQRFDEDTVELILMLVYMANDGINHANVSRARATAIMDLRAKYHGHVKELEAALHAAQKQAGGHGMACQNCNNSRCDLLDEQTRSDTLERERDSARANARILAHSYTHDSRPPQNVIDAALAYPVGLERRQ